MSGDRDDETVLGWAWIAKTTVSIICALITIAAVVSAFTR